ncbi:MAG TPA: hypothetical protein DHW82_06165 [Spirochaetia bacterium]|nr:MAG: hypothetical protein A2Y41_09145 [Spirochaetes bacterium GWB1_36_13]HCL56577.1 hypothetical protein [Spirochaetia bacterium]
MRGLIRRKPEEGAGAFNSLQDRINGVFDDFFGDLRSNQLWQCDFLPKVDVEEDQKAFLVKAEIPGMKKEEIEVELKDNVLTIKGEKKEEKEEKKEKKIYVKERVYGSFERSFSLPSEVEAENIKASFKDGVLMIEIPKAEPLRNSKKIEVK